MAVSLNYYKSHHFDSTSDPEPQTLILLLWVQGDVNDILNLFIYLPIPVTGPEGPSMSLVLSWELAFYEISVASQKN